MVLVAFNEFEGIFGAFATAFWGVSSV